MTLHKNALYISLDFELFWGRDSGYDYTQNHMTRYGLVHEVVPRLLTLFEKYKISATWATVGLLAIETPEELELFKPNHLPNQDYNYANNYERFKKIYKNNDHGNWVYGDKLIKQIVASPNQELASHTFAHIFCNEHGISTDIISADIQASKEIFQSKYGVEIESLVFPYNQIPDLKNNELGVQYIRSDNSHKIYKNRNILSYRKPLKRAIRLIDRYWNVTGKNNITLSQFNNYILIPESRFLPPSIGGKYGKRIADRIKSEITHAAISGQSYHLWWHPHNFTENMYNCFKLLEEILMHYSKLRDKYNMQSLCMNQANG